MAVNFTGRLAREMLRLTDTKTTTYIEPVGTWYDSKTKEEVMGIKVCFTRSSGASACGWAFVGLFLSFPSFASWFSIFGFTVLMLIIHVQF